MKKSVYLFICILAYLLYGIGIVLYTGKSGNIFFVWNVLLAFAPFVFIQILLIYLKKENRKRVVVVILSLLWLVFFPNSPYMITDLMYFTSTTCIDPDAFNTLFYWIKLLYIGSGVLFAALLGLSSLYDMHKLVIGWKGRIFGNGFLVIVSLLSGFAIYVGRMLRFNSWDVLRPLYLLKSVAQQLDLFAVSFSLVFTAYILGTYIVYYLVAHGREKAPDSL